MRLYGLKTKSGEIINRIRVSDYDDAISYFAKIKGIKHHQLTKIYLVERVF